MPPPDDELRRLTEQAEAAGDAGLLLSDALGVIVSYPLDWGEQDPATPPRLEKIHGPGYAPAVELEASAIPRLLTLCRASDDPAAAQRGMCAAVWASLAATGAFCRFAEQLFDPEAEAAAVQPDDPLTAVRLCRVLLATGYGDEADFVRLLSGVGDRGRSAEPELLLRAAACAFRAGLTDLCASLARRALDPELEPHEQHRALARFLLGEGPAPRSDVNPWIAAFTVLRADCEQPGAVFARDYCRLLEAVHAHYGTTETALALGMALVHAHDSELRYEMGPEDGKAMLERAMAVAASPLSLDASAALLERQSSVVQLATAGLFALRTDLVRRAQSAEQQRQATLTALGGPAAAPADGGGDEAAALPPPTQTDGDEPVLFDGRVFQSADAAYQAALQAAYPDVRWMINSSQMFVDIVYGLSGDHWVCVTRGFTCLDGGVRNRFAPATSDVDGPSGFGHEFVMRVERDAEEPPAWVGERLDFIARYVATSGCVVRRCDRVHDVFAAQLPRTPHVLCAPDGVLFGAARSRTGRVTFAQVTPVNDDELRLAQLWDSRQIARLLREALGDVIRADRRPLLAVHRTALAQTLDGVRRDGSSMSFDACAFEVKPRGAARALCPGTLAWEAVTLHVPLRTASSLVAAFLGRLAHGRAFVLQSTAGAPPVLCGAPGAVFRGGGPSFLASVDNPVVASATATHLFFTTAQAEAIGETLRGVQPGIALPAAFVWPGFRLVVEDVDVLAMRIVAGAPPGWAPGVGGGGGAAGVVGGLLDRAVGAVRGLLGGGEAADEGELASSSSSEEDEDEDDGL